jgi:class 3 adenylate cyclase/TolB-like protein/tetratricopeptide (TPR) repeat protein
MSQSRQLVAIMFTDIVGYTALMGDDEQKAFEILKKNRQIQRPLIEQNNGKWIKELGDGVLASFNTVSDAVNTAIKIQEACNLSKEFLLRIGIHHGEVVFEDDDIFGDAVNIASRLQALAPVGGIWISESVRNNIANKKEIETRYIKQETLKNVKEPVKIYEVITSSAVSSSKKTFTAQKEQIKDSAPKKSTKLLTVGVLVMLAIGLLGYFLSPLLNNEKSTVRNKWIAVLPFRLISSDPTIEWLSDGFTEELTSSIAGISDLKVKSPTTMMQYKNSKKSVREIAEELSVSSIIDGSLQKEGNTIIINARLINPTTEEILHNFKLRKDASEIKSIYSEVAQQVADILNVTITSAEKKRLQQVDKVDPELYNLFLQGMSHAKKFSLEEEQEAIRIFDRAIKKDSNYAPVLAGKAFAIMNMAVGNASLQSTEAIIHTDPLFAKSIALDSNLALTYSSRGWVEICLKWDLNNGEKSFFKSFSLDPTDDIALSGLIFVNTLNGNHKDANKWWETGKAISPYSWWVDEQHILTLCFLGKIDEAIQFSLDAIAKYNHPLLYERLGWTFNLNGQHKEAIEILEKGMAKFNTRPPSMLSWLASAYYKSGNRVKAGELLKELEAFVEKKTPNAAPYTAMAYASIGEKQKALNLLDKAYELHDVDMIWLKEEPSFKSIQNEPRYQAMLKKVGF